MEKENELEGPVFVRTDKWHAEYMQSNMQIDAKIFFLWAAQKPTAHQHTHSNLQTLAKGLPSHTLQLGAWEKL